MESALGEGSVFTLVIPARRVGAGGYVKDSPPR